jgi:hypothetical protein
VFHFGNSDGMLPENYVRTQWGVYPIVILVIPGIAQVSKPTDFPCQRIRRFRFDPGADLSPRRELNALSFHSLRHTATSLLKNAGVSDVVARDIIGHESEAVSRNYTHIDMETKRKAVDGMPDVLAVPVEPKPTGSKNQPPVPKQRPPASGSGT